MKLQSFLDWFGYIYETTENRKRFKFLEKSCVSDAAREVALANRE